MVNKQFNNYKEFVNWVISGAGILLALDSSFDLFGFLKMDEKIPEMILGLIGVLSINSILERRNELKQINLNTDKIISITSEENLKKLEREKELKQINLKTDKIISITSGDNLKKLDHITQDIPKVLSIIFKDYINDYRDFFKNAIKNEVIKFSNLEKFKSSFIKALEYKKKQSKDTTFFATSLPYRRYFWDEKTTPMMKAISDFVESSGNNFERIFFLEEGDSKNKEVIEVLDKQIEFGITTYTILIEDIPDELQRYFVVDEMDELAWEATINTKQEINNTKFTTSTNTIKKLKSIYLSLKCLTSFTKYNSSRRND